VADSGLKDASKISYGHRSSDHFGPSAEIFRLLKKEVMASLDAPMT
jgi:hypothetical protein